MTVACLLLMVDNNNNKNNNSAFPLFDIILNGDPNRVSFVAQLGDLIDGGCKKKVGGR